MNNAAIVKAILFLLLVFWMGSVEQTLSRILYELRKMNEKENDK